MEREKEKKKVEVRFVGKEHNQRKCKEQKKFLTKVEEESKDKHNFFEKQKMMRCFGIIDRHNPKYKKLMAPKEEQLFESPEDKQKR